MADTKLITALALLFVVTAPSGLSRRAEALASSGNEIIDFAGELQSGRSYRAEVEYDDSLKMWRTVVPVKLPFHHAGTIVWDNLSDFDELKNAPPGARSFFVFKVKSKRVVNMTNNRWDTTYDCQITSHRIKLVGQCLKTTSGRTRLMSYGYTFEVKKVLEGVYRDKQVEFQVFGTRDGIVLWSELRAVCPGEDAGKIATESKEVELILRRYPKGVLFGWKTIELEAIEVRP
jgi:hypothetical protein